MKLSDYIVACLGHDPSTAGEMKATLGTASDAIKTFNWRPVPTPAIQTTPSGSMHVEYYVVGWGTEATTPLKDEELFTAITGMPAWPADAIRIHRSPER